MRLDKYFITKAVSLFVIVGLIFLCNSYLNKENAIKAAALEEQEKQVKENEEKLARSKKDSSETGGESGTYAEDSGESGKYADGTYDGEAQGFGGLIQVRVTVEQGKVAEVELLYAGKEDAAYLESALDVIEEMKASGDTDVDTVSGATYSSTGIINAAKTALEAAEK